MPIFQFSPPPPQLFFSFPQSPIRCVPPTFRSAPLLVTAEKIAIWSCPLPRYWPQLSALPGSEKMPHEIGASSTEINKGDRATHSVLGSKRQRRVDKCPGQVVKQGAQNIGSIVARVFGSPNRQNRSENSQRAAVITDWVPSPNSARAFPPFRNRGGGGGPKYHLVGSLTNFRSRTLQICDARLFSAEVND